MDANGVVVQPDTRDSATSWIDSPIRSFNQHATSLVRLNAVLGRSGVTHGRLQGRSELTLETWIDRLDSTKIVRRERPIAPRAVPWLDVTMPRRTCS
jgi:hypothetical protein